MKENISIGHIDFVEKDYNEMKLKEIAENCGVDSFANELPNKYETRLTRLFQKGVELSGGQWQRIALARSLYRDSDIIILDEPTASLDPIKELEFYSSMLKTTANKTSIFITHRMASAKMADRIFVLKDGCLIEEGNHELLISKKGHYHDMYRSQAKWYEESNEFSKVEL